MKKEPLVKFSITVVPTNNDDNEVNFSSTVIGAHEDIQQAFFQLFLKAPQIVESIENAVLLYKSKKNKK